MKKKKYKKKVVLLGYPGCGKNTFVKAFRARYQCGHISPGDCGREEAKKGTELGRIIASYQERGQLITLDILRQLLRPKMELFKDENLLFKDGFPRNLLQVGLFFEFFEEYGFHSVDVIHFDIPLSLIHI